MDEHSQVPESSLTSPRPRGMRLGDGLGGDEEPRPTPGLTSEPQALLAQGQPPTCSVLLEKAQVMVCSSFVLCFICCF